VSQIVGGLRARLIRDSTYRWIYDGLAALGWFDAGRRHLPVSFTGKPVDADQEIQFNTVALVDLDTGEYDLELGSNLAEHRTTYYVDFYAESDVVGKELIHDVRDILAGRMSSIGRAHPHVPVYDYRQATPPLAFYVEVEDLVVDRAHDFPKPWLKNWYACRFDIVDHYGDETSG
jgi:hypothetical protein